MVQQPSPIRHFNRAREERRRALLGEQGRGQDSQLSSLELSVISCFGVVQETVIHMAESTVNHGIAQVENYLPLAHETLAHLRNFIISLAIAPCYGAYFLPNAELRAMADSLSNMGIHMKYHTETGRTGSSGPNTVPLQLNAVGAAVVQRALEMRKFASTTYFFSEDLTDAFKEGWRRLNHAEDIFNELFAQALSAKALSEAYRPRTNELLGLVVMSYGPIAGKVAQGCT